MPALDAADNERRAQIERVKEAGFAAISGRTIAQREKARATKADEWASWWRREMEIPIAMIGPDSGRHPPQPAPKSFIFIDFTPTESDSGRQQPPHRC